MAIQGFNEANRQQTVAMNTDLTNNSGQGSNSPVLDIVSKKFNWGAFMLNWIWGLGNKTFITLIIFPVSLAAYIPFVGWLITLGCSIWFGIKGNEWAWQNKRWQSIEHFHSVQKKWAIGGVIAFFVQILLIALVCVAMFIPLTMNEKVSGAHNRTATLKSINTLTEVAIMGETLEKKCTPTSTGLASYFAEETNVANHSGNIVETRDGIVWTFSGNGYCNKEGDCSVTITNEKGLNEIIPFTVENGYIKVLSEELINKYVK